jgi:hypothetical protein
MRLHIKPLIVVFFASILLNSSSFATDSTNLTAQIANADDAFILDCSQRPTYAAMSNPPARLRKGQLVVNRMHVGGWSAEVNYFLENRNVTLQFSPDRRVSFSNLSIEIYIPKEELHPNEANGIFVATSTTRVGWILVEPPPMTKDTALSTTRRLLKELQFDPAASTAWLENEMWQTTPWFHKKYKINDAMIELGMESAELKTTPPIHIWMQFDWVNR